MTGRLVILFTLALAASVLSFAYARPVQDDATLLVPEGEDSKAILEYPWDSMRAVNAVAFSPDGHMVATGSDDGIARLWDTKTGKLLQSWLGHKAGINSVAFSVDGNILATGSDNATAARLWDTKTGKLFRTLLGHQGGVRSIAFSPTGGLVATGSDDNTAILWELKNGKPLFPLRGHAGSVESVAFSPDGQFVATGSADGTARIWDTRSGDQSRSLGERYGSVHAVAFSPNGKLLATGCADHIARVWDIETGSVLHHLPHQSGSVQSVAFSPDGLTLATGSANRASSSVEISSSGSTKLWDTKSGELLRSLEGQRATVNSVTFSPDGELVAVGSKDRTAKLWDAKTGKLLRSLESLSSPINSVSFSPDGQLVAIGSEDNTAKLWDIRTGKLFRSLHGHSAPLHAVVFSPDGQLLATGSDDGTVKIWEAKTGVLLQSLETLSALILSVAFSPDGRTVAAGSNDRLARLWDAKTGKLLFSLPGHGSSVLSIAFSPDGLTVVTGSYDGIARLWKAGTGSQIRSFQSHISPVNAVAFSPNGQMLVTGADDHTATLWEIKTAKLLRSLQGHTAPVNAVAFSPDGQQVATSSDDSTARVWNVKTGKPSRSLRGHNDWVGSVAFSPDGKLLATGSDDSTVRIWDRNTGLLLGMFGLSGTGWAAVAPSTGKLYRHDDGRVLSQKGLDGSIEPVLPPQPARSAVLRMTLSDVAVQPVLDAEATGSVTVRIANAVTAGTAYWLRLSSPDMPKHALLLPPEPYLRLAPGESVDLPVEVSALAKAVDNSGPQPGRLMFTLQLDHAFGAGPSLPIDLPIRAPSIALAEAKLSGDRTNAQVGLLLRNDGDQDPHAVSAEGCLLPDNTDETMNSAESVALCQAKGSLQLFENGTLSPGKSVALSLSVPQELRSYYRPMRVKLTIRGGIWPTHVWHCLSKPLQLRPPLLLWSGAAALLISLLAAGLFLRLYLDPIVRQVAKEPSRLLRLSLPQVPTADRVLRRLGRLESALIAASISSERWARTLIAGHEPTAAVQVFCEALGAKLGEPIITVHPAFAVEFPPLRLRFAKHSAVIVLIGRTLEPGAVARLAADVYAGGQGPSVVVALDLTMTQRAGLALAEATHVAFIVLTMEVLRDLLLGGHEREILEAAISSQRPIIELSPYQIGGGVEDPRMFYGRAMELRRLADEKLHNVLLVGPRQMGKSSLLNALERRLPQRRDVLAVHRITLSDGHLLTSAARALGQAARSDSADDSALFALLAGERDRPRVWLIDEADALVTASGWQGTARVLRALSEENRAHFVLAGFWSLYVAAALDPHSPLRNFGQTLRLGPLEREAARALVIEPLSALGLLFEAPGLIDQLLDETGCRANLLALCCDGLIRTLGPTDRMISRGQIDRVLTSYSPLLDELKYWRTSPVRSQAPLDRAVLRAALLLRQRTEPASAATIRQQLQATGTRIPNEDYRQSLDRLELGYLLVPEAPVEPVRVNSGPRGLRCPVPLIAAAVAQEQDLAAGIADDLTDLAEDSA